MSSASLHGRVTKLERIDGGRVPSEEEFRVRESFSTGMPTPPFFPSFSGLKRTRAKFC